MAKGYVGRRRARRAFDQGVASVDRGRGRSGYSHPHLVELYNRGRQKALSGQLTRGYIDNVRQCMRRQQAPRATAGGRR